ncbi:MAG: type II toxin-antitoxin system VapC family toxin [Coriobacteriales bacterium]|jgi:PIN domain nuclease of toxin-antitoxin system|nr:type II toxin-antitoxin system VapC family toxin [Coriobacteriales bacterium]
MNYQVDTHILLWSLFDPERLPQGIESILLDEDNSIYYNVVNLWEISIKYGLKKLFLEGLEPSDIFEELLESFYRYEDLEPFVAVGTHQLPLHHKDPFDRLLVYDAIYFDRTLLSVDSRLAAYRADGLKLISGCE